MHSLQLYAIKDRSYCRQWLSLFPSALCSGTWWGQNKARGSTKRKEKDTVKGKNNTNTDLYSYFHHWLSNGNSSPMPLIHPPPWKYRYTMYINIKSNLCSFHACKPQLSVSPSSPPILENRRANQILFHFVIYTRPQLSLRPNKHAQPWRKYTQPWKLYSVSFMGPLLHVYKKKKLTCALMCPAIDSTGATLSCNQAFVYSMWPSKR